MNNISEIKKENSENTVLRPICDICQEACIPSKLYEKMSKIEKESKIYCIFDTLIFTNGYIIQGTYRKNDSTILDTYDEKPGFTCEYSKK